MLYIQSEIDYVEEQTCLGNSLIYVNAFKELEKANFLSEPWD